MKYSEFPVSAIELRMKPNLKDAAKRMSDTVNLYLTTHGWEAIKHCFIAFRLSDGTTDGAIYDNRKDAVRHQRDEFQCYYFSFRDCHAHTTPREMAIIMQFAREAHDAGFRLPDPDHASGGFETLMTAARYDDIKTRLGL